MFQNEYRELSQLLDERPCEPFEYEDAKEKEDSVAHDTKTVDETTPSHSDSDDEEFYDAVSFDDLFFQHSRWLQRLETLKPSYQTCVELAREAKEVNTKLCEHLRESNRRSITTSRKWSMFDEMVENNDKDVFEKQKKQMECRLKDINESIRRFHEDLVPRKEKLADWEGRVADKWRQVSSLFGLYGVPMNKASVSTLQWLHEKDIVSSGYLGLFDVGHYLCSALLPYRKSIMCGAVFAQYASTWGVDWVTSMRACCSLELLNLMYPCLREFRTSNYVIRTDTLIAMFAMYTCDVDGLTNLKLCSVVQLWMMLCANDMSIHYPYSGENVVSTMDIPPNDVDDNQTKANSVDTETAHDMNKLASSDSDSDSDSVVKTVQYTCEDDVCVTGGVVGDDMKEKAE